MIRITTIAPTVFTSHPLEVFPATAFVMPNAPLHLRPAERSEAGPSCGSTGWAWALLLWNFDIEGRNYCKASTGSRSRNDAVPEHPVVQIDDVC